MIKKITVTGADDSTNLNFLITTTHKYPLVEWGILVSKNNTAQGLPRFPSKNWLSKACYTLPKHINLSCHLCGSWVRDLCFEGSTQFIEDIPIKIFKRIQLNFHAIVHKINQEKFIEALKRFSAETQFIFQLDNVNNNILTIAKEAGINAVPLFDTSGGTGMLPLSWPPSVDFAGYAGGLSPTNLVIELPKIIKDSENKPIWIDAETHLRSNNDKLFDQLKVLEFLKQTYIFIEKN